MLLSSGEERCHDDAKRMAKQGRRQNTQKELETDSAEKQQSLTSYFSSEILFPVFTEKNCLKSEKWL